MIKVLAGAIKHPVNRSQDEFHRYWIERHGPLFSKSPELRRYVQHHSLPEAYSGTPTPNLHGASMFWYDDLDVMRNAPPSPRLAEAITPADGVIYEHYVASKRYGDPETMTLRETVMADDRQLFDRTPDWPLSGKRTSIVAEERVIVDGQTTPGMVKAIWAFTRKPGLTLEEFQKHWFEVHGHELGAKLPGMRRYVQNHSLPEVYGLRPMTHDGWSEAWWDDLESLHRSRQSDEWKRLSEDGQTLFTYPMAVVVARETIQKDFPSAVLAGAGEARA
jgi:uncharacterized protein (TIGR02118 family)